MAEKKTTKSIEALRKLTPDELTNKIAELKQHLAEQYRSHAAGELPSPAVLGKIRREIAQAHTLLTAARYDAKQGAVKAPEPTKENK